MDGLREFVVHISATAMICALVVRITQGNSTIKRIIKLLCGVVMAISIVQPIKQMNMIDIDDVGARFQDEAAQAVQLGKNTAMETWNESISQGVEAYILEKAKTMKVDLGVEVELSKDEIPVPVGVSLTGNVSPYAKSVLSDTISQELNIPKEKQIWISQS
jgi:hypothetical protein